MSKLTEQEIIEGNIKIAEFEKRIWRAYKGNSSYTKPFYIYSKCLDFINKHQLKDYKPSLGYGLGTGEFHEDWNWLNSALEAVGKKCYSFYRINGDNSAYAELATNSRFLNSFKADGNTRIAATFRCVVLCVDFLSASTI